MVAACAIVLVMKRPSSRNNHNNQQPRPMEGDGRFILPCPFYALCDSERYGTTSGNGRIKPRSVWARVGCLVRLCGEGETTERSGGGGGKCVCSFRKFSCASLLPKVTLWKILFLGVSTIEIMYILAFDQRPTNSHFLIWYNKQKREYANGHYFIRDTWSTSLLCATAFLL